MVYTAIDLCNMDVMETDPTACSGLFSSHFDKHEAAASQMSGVRFGVNGPLWGSALIDLRTLHTISLYSFIFFLAN